MPMPWMGRSATGENGLEGLFYGNWNYGNWNQECASQKGRRDGDAGAWTGRSTTGENGLKGLFYVVRTHGPQDGKGAQGQVGSISCGEETGGLVRSRFKLSNWL
jgi:hypothetical protein